VSVWSRTPGRGSSNTRNGNPLAALNHLSGWFYDTAVKHGVFTFDCEAVSGQDFYVDSVLGDILLRRLRPRTPCLRPLDLPD